MVLTVIVLSFLSSCGGTKKKKDEVDFSRSVSVSDSVDLLTSQIKKDSSDAGLWKERAGLYLKKGNIDAAFRDLNSALELDKNDPELYILLADIYFAIGKEDNSLSAIKKAIDLDPKNPDYYLKMAKFKLMLQKYRTAEAFADKVISLDPENAQALYVKAIAALEQHDTIRALRMMKIATNLDTNFFAANLNVAVILDARDDSGAIKYYKRALRIKPDNLITEYSLAMFYQKQGNFKKALETYEHNVAIHPEHAQSYYNMGYIYLTEYLDYNKAVEMFGKAIEADPDYTEAVYNLGRTYEAMGDTVRAMEKYRQALKLTTNYQLAIDGLNRLEK
jgi:tetratricopeptide (TPR) repeat protein